LYADLIAVRNQELNALWTRFNIHLLINGGLLVAALSAPADSLARRPEAYLFGGSLTGLWYISDRVGRQALHFWDSKLKDYEDCYWSGSRPYFSVFGELPGFGPARSQLPRRSWNVLRTNLRDQSRVSRLVISTFMVAWVTLLALL
jgi:hypothetical protein